MTTKLKWILVLFFVCSQIVFLNTANAQDENPIDLDATPSESLTPASAPASSPTEVKVDPAMVKSKEEQIQEEYDNYMSKKSEALTEDKLRQRVFHEGSSNQIFFDVSRDDLANFDYGLDAAGLQVKRGDNTIGIGGGYQRFLINSRYTGRIGIGFGTGVIGTNARKGHFRSAFWHAGPRASYEFKYLTGQIIVPVVLVGFDHVFNLSHSISPSIREDFNTFVYGAGLYFNLNRLDPSTGTHALVNTGIRKFNIAVLYQAREGSSKARSSQAVIAGLRFEY